MAPLKRRRPRPIKQRQSPGATLREKFKVHGGKLLFGGRSRNLEIEAAKGMGALFWYVAYTIHGQGS
jgi:hypothetical protein